MTLLERAKALSRCIQVWMPHEHMTADLIHNAKQELAALMDRARFDPNGWEAAL